MPDVGQPKVTRLHDLVVHEVSLVDKPANQRKFLIVKSAETNEASTQKDSAMPADATDTSKTNDAVDDAMAAKANEDTTLVTEIDPEVQLALSDSLDKAGDRLKALAASVKSAKTAEKAFDSDKPKIPPKLLQEVVNIRAGLGSMIGKSDDSEDGVEKAKTMADPEKQKEVEGEKADGKKGKPAFLKEKEDDADKSKDGAEKGKGKGHWSQKDKSASLMDVLEKFAAMDLDADAMKMLYSEAASKCMYKAAAELHDGNVMEAAKSCGMAMKIMGSMGPSNVSMAEQIDEIGKSLEDVEKAGRKMSAARWKELDKSLRQLLELAEQIKPGYKAELAGVTKSAGAVTIQQLVDLVRKKDDEIKTLKSSRPAPNTSGAGESDPKASRPFRWSKDLNADYNDPNFPDELKF